MKIGTWTVTRQFVRYAGGNKSKRQTWYDVTCDCGKKRTFAAKSVAECVKCAAVFNEERATKASLALEEATDTVFDICGISAEHILSRDRSQGTSAARNIVAILMRKAGYSFAEIGRVMGREHTTIMRMCAKESLESNATIVARHVDAVTAKQAAAPKTIPLRDFKRASSELARQMRERLIALKLENVADEVKDEREVWDQSLIDLKGMLPEQRTRMWRELCKSLFPHTWQKQFATPPLGLQIGAQEVLAIGGYNNA